MTARTAQAWTHPRYARTAKLSNGRGAEEGSAKLALDQPQTTQESFHRQLLHVELGRDVDAELVLLLQAASV